MMEWLAGGEESAFMGPESGLEFPWRDDQDKGDAGLPLLLAAPSLRYRPAMSRRTPTSMPSSCSAT
jgi:hypothetical protein